ncbi:MAG: hypothetical protein A3A86_07845 [Elusimicrobia bacterium RIFCSPLOWO2_01_FULL_60_11]|nr:MAG: hypothetical protein A3A86_07845 [Elusimicrobia bacterium RIFCSPLOWO2_01_FULL_60_11]
MRAAKGLGIFLTVFGCKLWLIDSCAVSCPFWDEWDVEASALFKPILENMYLWKNLLAPHNEHHLLMTRLLGLALFKLNGLWDPRLAMAVNAAVHSLTAAAFYWAGTKLTREKWLDWFWTALVLAVFALPLAFEDPLMGLQSQVYSVILFSAAAVWLFARSEPFTVPWALGLLAALAAHLSMASGMLSALAGAAIIALKCLAERRWTVRRAAGLAVLSGLFILGYLHLPSMGGSVSSKAASLAAFSGVFSKMLSAPGFSNGWLAAVIWLPFFAFLALRLRERAELSKEDLLLFGYGSLVILTAAALAYGRGGVPGIPSRYFDFLLPGLLVNFLAIAALLDGLPQNFRARLALAAAFWGLLAVSGFWNQTLHQMTHGIPAKKELGRIQQANVKEYLATGDFSHLKDKPWCHIPYPSASAGELKAFLDDPTIQSFLPESIRPPSQGGKTGRLTAALAALLKNWIEFARPGVIILLGLFFYRIFKDETASTP